MNSVSAELCPTCPMRGLCVGDEVTLTTEKWTATLDDTQNGTRVEYTGAAIQAIDTDGVQNPDTIYAPETAHETVQIEGKDALSISLPNAVHNDPIYTALTNHADVLLPRIAIRAKDCPSPYEPESGFAQRPHRVCRAAGTIVLETLAKQVIHKINER